LNTKYEDVKNLYFLNKELNGEKCQENLKAIADEKNNESANAAYLLAIIYLKNSIKFDQPLDHRYYYDNWVMEKQDQFFKAGLTWLEKAIDLGSKNAAQLLGQIYLSPSWAREIDVILDEKIIIKFTGDRGAFSFPNLVQKCYGSFLLQTEYLENKACTQLLCDLASAYFKALNLDDDLPYSIFSTTADLLFEKFCKSIEPKDDSDPIITEEVQTKFRELASNNSYRAIMLCKQLNIELDLPYEKLIWKAKYEAYTRALEWLKHGTKLGCDISTEIQNTSVALLTLFRNRGYTPDEKPISLVGPHVFWQQVQSDTKTPSSINAYESGPF
jgi:TPR repeat protein